MSDRRSPDRLAEALVALALALSLGHHLDHVLRGQHLGWPLTDEVTPFTYSLVIYPLALLGFVLTRTGRAGPGYWALLSGPAHSWSPRSTSDRRRSSLPTRSPAPTPTRRGAGSPWPGCCSSSSCSSRPSAWSCTSGADSGRRAGPAVEPPVR